jgi:hypothetical protein
MKNIPGFEITLLAVNGTELIDIPPTPNGTNARLANMIHRIQRL